MKKKIDSLLLIGYCLVLLIECAALYKSRFHYYQIARLLTSVILFLLIYKGDKARVISLYIYTAFSLVVTADILTLFFQDIWFYFGKSLFTFSYLSFAAIFYRFRQIKEHKDIPPVLSVLAILLTILLALYYFIPDIRETITIVQVIVHVLVIGILFIWAIKVNRRTNKKNPYFLPTAIFIILANMCYLIDVNLLNRKYVLLDISVVFFHGVYLLLLSKAVNKNTSIQTSTIVG